MTETDLSLLQDMIAAYVNKHPGCSEHDLINWLKAPEQAYFDASALSDSQMLFRTHFLVMHCLYRLREQWLKQAHCWLEISPLSINKLPLSDSTSGSAVTDTDALAAYYLNLEELATSQEDVEAMLRNFWQRLLIPQSQPDDLATLELDESADAKTIRAQYRRLAMTHHPDKGGDSERFQQITSAYQRLRQRA